MISRGSFAALVLAVAACRPALKESQTASSGPQEAPASAAPASAAPAPATSGYADVNGLSLY